MNEEIDEVRAAKIDRFLKDFKTKEADPFEMPEPEKKEIIKFFTDKLDLARQFLTKQPIYYDSAKNWWLWQHDEYRWERIDETDLLNHISSQSYADTVKSRDKMEIIEALRQVSRKNKPKETPKHWIQFKNVIVDLKTGWKINATAEYFVTNPIPWKLGHTDETPNMDRIFTEWVGEEHVKTLYQIIAYCLLPDYPLNRLFCLIGAGMNGKTKYTKLITNFVGMKNTASTELDLLLNSRFEATRMHKKLVCQMGETNFNELKQTAVIKRLTGDDLMNFEYKNKDLIEEYNYAKIIISTNNLPTTTDKTLGFYRRWLIIDFPNQFTEKKDILADIPEEEYNNLALKSIDILKDLLEVKEFHNEGTAEERGVRYEEKSNPFDKFWNEMVEEDFDAHIYKFEFRKSFDEWCTHNHFRKLSDSSIKDNMKDKGVTENKLIVTEEWYVQQDAPTKRYNAWVGIRFKKVKDSVAKVVEKEQDDIVKSVKAVKGVKGVPLSPTRMNLSDIPLTPLTPLTHRREPENQSIYFDDTKSIDKSIKPMKSDKIDKYLEEHPTGDLETLDQKIGVKMSQKLLKTGVIFEEKPGRYITL